MSRARLTAMRGSAAALLALAACSPAAEPPPSRAPLSAVAAPDMAVEGLHHMRDAQAPLSPTGRNPFRFAGSGESEGGGARRSARVPLPPPDGLPVLPLPLAQPPLRLLGLITLTDGAKLAVLSVGSDLVMARIGDVVAGRFRVVSVGEDAVELTDAVGERPVRLALP